MFLGGSLSIGRLAHVADGPGKDSAKLPVSDLPLFIRFSRSG
jgi:hypothetical protein